MDSTEFGEDKFLTPELVKASPTKKCVITDEAHAEETKFGHRFTCTVQIDGKFKKWNMNKDSVRNMQSINKDSKFWMGLPVQLIVVNSGGKDKVIGSPIPQMSEPAVSGVNSPISGVMH